RKQCDIVEKNTGNTVVGSAVYSIDCSSRILGYRSAARKQKKGFASIYSFLHPTVAGRTEWFRQNRYTDDPLFFRAQDSELWSRTTRNSVFVNLEEPLLFYREGGAFSYRNYLSAKT